MNSFSDKFKNFLNNPKLLWSYGYDWYSKKTRKPYRWSSATYRGLKKKEYRNYEEYVLHQKSKLKLIENSWMPQYDINFHKFLKARLVKSKIVKKGQSVLCLAARIGTEVRVFRDLGLFAVGVDLNPGKNNQYVLPGDFHRLIFSDQSADIIYTNSLDHAFNLGKLFSEVRRVIKLGGYFISEISIGEKEGGVGGYFEATFWEDKEVLPKLIKSYGFKIVKRVDFDYPWKGTTFIFKRIK